MYIYKYNAPPTRDDFQTLLPYLVMPADEHACCRGIPQLQLLNYSIPQQDGVQDFNFLFSELRKFS
jgi:hypothetical protein